jgi:uncharacterized membrane protein YedE/YeeE
MEQWIGALVWLAVVVALLQWASRKWRHRPLPLLAAHGISLVLSMFLWSLLAPADQSTFAQRLFLSAVMYIPPQLVLLLLDWWGISHPTSFFRGPSASIRRPRQLPEKDRLIERGKR